MKRFGISGTKSLIEGSMEGFLFIFIVSIALALLIAAVLDSGEDWK